MSTQLLKTINSIPNFCYINEIKFHIKSNHIVPFSLHSSPHVSGFPCSFCYNSIISVSHLFTTHFVNERNSNLRLRSNFPYSHSTTYTPFVLFSSLGNNNSNEFETSDHSESETEKKIQKKNSDSRIKRKTSKPSSSSSSLPLSSLSSTSPITDKDENLNTINKRPPAKRNAKIIVKRNKNSVENEVCSSSTGMNSEKNTSNLNEDNFNSKTASKTEIQSSEPDFASDQTKPNSSNSTPNSNQNQDQDQAQNQNQSSESEHKPKLKQDEHRTKPTASNSTVNLTPNSTPNSILNSNHNQNQDQDRKQSFETEPKSKPKQEDDHHWKNVFPSYMQSKEEDESSVFQHFFDHESSNGHTLDSLNGVSFSHDFKISPNFSMDEISKAVESSNGDGFYISPSSFAQPPSSSGSNLNDLISHDPIWAVIIGEARLEADREPLLSSFLYASILAHSCLERSLSFVLANRLKNATLLATQLMEIFEDLLMQDAIRHAIRADVQAVKYRDPSCRSYSSALLYNKGYHAIQAYRISHALWQRGQTVLSLAMQSRISEVFAVDIHPAARIGYGILLDHGTGVVIGETAVVGDRVSMLQGVTLGGTGKEAGDRHPKIGDGVLIGAGATVLGNIKVGRGAMIAAGSLVLKDVKPHSMVAGTPARVVGMVNEPSPSLTMKHDATKDYYINYEENEHGHGDSLCEGAGI